MANKLSHFAANQASAFLCRISAAHFRFCRGSKFFSEVKNGMKLKASALVYSLTVTVLIAATLGIMIMLSMVSRIESDLVYFGELAGDNAESGINKVLYGLGPKFGRFEEQLFNSEGDSFNVRSFNWGLFGVMHAEGVHGSAKKAHTVLFGIKPEGVFSSTLFLSDRGKPLTLAGNTELKGELYVPEAGIRRGYVGRNGFTGNHLYLGEKKSSGGQHALPEYSQLALTRELLSEVLRLGFRESEPLLPGEKVKVSFRDETVFLGGRGEIHLRGVELRGNIAIIGEEVRVDADSRLDHVLIFGNRVYIEDGFRGRVQVFATDTIKTGKECRFEYPSVLMVSNPENQCELVLGKNCELEGMVVNDATFFGERSPKNGYTLLDSGSVVFGNVIVGHNLDVKGKVYGNVISGNFFLQTSGAMYENYLLDAVISEDSLGRDYAMGIILLHPREFIIVDRLE